MDLTLAQTNARRLLDEHGLNTWQIRFDNARRRCGSCHFSKREITLSIHFIQLNNSNEVDATILHEIAHALAGPGTAHGERWQTVARDIGAPLRSTNTTATMPEPPWHLQCLSCDRILARRHRRSLNLNRVQCAACGPGRLQWLQGDS